MIVFVAARVHELIVFAKQKIQEHQTDHHLSSLLVLPFLFDFHSFFLDYSVRSCFHLRYTLRISSSFLLFGADRANTTLECLKRASVRHTSVHASEAGGGRDIFCLRLRCVFPSELSFGRSAD